MNNDEVALRSEITYHTGKETLELRPGKGPTELVEQPYVRHAVHGSHLLEFSIQSAIFHADEMVPFLLEHESRYALRFGLQVLPFPVQNMCKR